jgi:hypothetical protein
MIEAAMLLAFVLHRDPALVYAVYEAGGLDAVAVVECESQFCISAWRREPDGATSYGLFQLDSKYHKQYRDDPMMHIVTGVSFLAECKQERTFAQSVAVYNGGARPGRYSVDWGRKVERKRNSLALFLWRRLR